jgi:hypothetical protein
MSVSAQQLSSSMLPQIHRHCSSFWKSPSSRPFPRSNYRRRCCLKSTATAVRFANLQAHVCFRTTPAVVDVASNPSPLEFIPEISKLLRTTGARCGVCLDFCFSLILCFLFAPSFIAVETFVLNNFVCPGSLNGGIVIFLLA